MAETASNISSGKDILQEFQLAKLSISEKSSREFGIALSRKIWGFVGGGLGTYYYQRNARFQKNADFAYGRINVQAMFQDRFQYNGKQNYIRLAWNTLQLVNRIVSGLVGRWMERNEKIVVKAIDSLSQTEKKEDYERIKFILENKAALEKLQAESGVRMIPNEELPADKEELNLWQEQFQRIPEEIVYELGCNDVLSSNGWFTTLKEMVLRDSCVKGLVGTYTYMDDQGVVHVEWMKPDNIIYAATDYDDFRDTAWRGQMPSIKISELRRRYGKEFNPDNPYALTEEQLFAIAQTAREYKAVSNINWDAGWMIPFSIRPYDEWNVRSIEFELKTVDSEPYTVTTTPFNRTYVRKGAAQEKPNNWAKTSQYSDTNWNIYRGVFLPDNDILLEWGLKKNMIRPQDPKEIGNAEFSYSLFMYQNYLTRNLAIPEKIEAAIDGMMLACLKIQQVISRMRPTGAAINEDALQDIDFGLGDAGNKAVDKKKLYDQTGDIYYRGRDAEGNPIPIPITELANSGFIGQIEGLIRDYQFWYETLKDDLGEDPRLISQALQPRVTASNVEASQTTAQYATDYMYNAYIRCMEQTATKISCLLKDSVTYGAKAYREIVNTNISERQFSTEIQMMPTQGEVQRFDLFLTTSLNSNPELNAFVNQFQLIRIARENVKLAEVLYRQAQKKYIQYQQQTAQQNQQATFQAQVASAQAAEQAKQQTEQLKGDIELQKEKLSGETANKNYIVAMVTSLLSKGEQIPPYLIPVVSATMENILIPLAVQNDQQKAALIQQYQQAQQQMMQEQQQQSIPTQQTQPIQQPPQSQVAA